MNDTIISTADSEASGLSGRQYKNGDIDIWHKPSLANNAESGIILSITITKKALPKVIEFLNECQK